MHIDGVSACFGPCHNRVDARLDLRIVGIRLGKPAGENVLDALGGHGHDAACAHFVGDSDGGFHDEGSPCASEGGPAPARGGAWWSVVEGFVDLGQAGDQALALGTEGFTLRLRVGVDALEAQFLFGG